MKYLILLLFLVGCAECPKEKRRDYKYGDKVTVMAGFYKGQKGIITNTGRKLYRKEVIGMDLHCTSPTFHVKLEDGETVQLSQYSLFVEDEKEKTTVECKIKDKEEVKICQPCIYPPQPEVKPKEEPKPKEPSTCVKKIESEARKCFDIDCKMKLAVKLRKCPDYN